MVNKETIWYDCTFDVVNELRLQWGPHGWYNISWKVIHLPDWKHPPSNHWFPFILWNSKIKSFPFPWMLAILTNSPCLSAICLAIARPRASFVFFGAVLVKPLKGERQFIGGETAAFITDCYISPCFRFQKNSPRHISPITFESTPKSCSHLNNSPREPMHLLFVLTNAQCVGLLFGVSFFISDIP